MFVFLAALLSFTTHDLSRWHETTPPGAPFTLDVPLGLEDKGFRDVSGTKVHRWARNFGLMSIQIEYDDRTTVSSFSTRDTLEMLGGGLLKEWGPSATAKVTDITMAGRPAVQLDLQRTAESGTIVRTRIVRFRIGEDEWKIQTTHAGDSSKDDVTHFWSSVQPARAPAILTPATIGRLSMKAPGKAKVTDEPLSGENAKSMEKWTVHAFADQGMTVWVYHLRFREGHEMDRTGVGQYIVDNVIAQSNPKPRFYLYEQDVGNVKGMMTSGQATTAEGDEAVRIFSIKDGREGWAMLAAGPNSARTEGMLRDMVKSVMVTP